MKQKTLSRTLFSLQSLEIAIKVFISLVATGLIFITAFVALTDWEKIG
jgi:hypothetical protein